MAAAARTIAPERTPSLLTMRSAYQDAIDSADALARRAGHPLLSGLLGRRDSRRCDGRPRPLPADPIERPRRRGIRRDPAPVRGRQARAFARPGYRGVRAARAAARARRFGSHRGHRDFSGCGHECLPRDGAPPAPELFPYEGRILRRGGFGRSLEAPVRPAAQESVPDPRAGVDRGRRRSSAGALIPYCFTRAIMSISTVAPLGRAATMTVERAGR